MYEREREVFRASFALLIAVFILLVGGCGGDGLDLGETHSVTTTDPGGLPGGAGRDGELGAGYTVNSTVVLTGAAARVEAGPLGSPQGIDDLGGGINPWGPVQIVHEVTIGEDTYIVNQLASPDPFTATYQLEDGRIIVSNEPLGVIATFNGTEGPFPDPVLWTSEMGDDWEAMPGRMYVYFDSAATEQEIAQIIDSENLHVVLSWFEPLDEGGSCQEKSTSLIGTPIKEYNSASEDTPGSSGSVSDAILALPATTGNEIAWFDFEYDQALYPDVEFAYQHFKTIPYVVNVCPHINDYGQSDYDYPNDPVYQQLGQNRSLWIDAFNLSDYSQIPLDNYTTSPNQMIAVVDSGVHRTHEDVGKLFPVGVNCYSKTIEVAVWGGVPDFPMDKDRWEGTPYYHRLYGHGTQVAYEINSRTNNGKGVPSLAPSACILPIRLKHWSKFYGFTDKDPLIAPGAAVKAVRALRFEFRHDRWTSLVRVVNMSISWPSGLRNLPWSDPGVTGNFKWNVSRDLAKNDRLYIASAGNQGIAVRAYPAAHSNVLGVSGYWYNPNGTSISSRFYPHERSNYNYNQDVYPVSGIYNINSQSGDIDWPTLLPITPEDHPYYKWTTYSNEYRPFSGTSAAAPQISALAYHLYSRRPNLSGPSSTTYTEVWDHIVTTRMLNEHGYYHDIYPYRAPADYHRAIDSW
ncbi:S8/S53 family peptidase [bacterium]|nr:S8/S53 family peptidase [bacterium]